MLVGLDAQAASSSLRGARRRGNPASSSTPAPSAGGSAPSTAEVSFEVGSTSGPAGKSPSPTQHLPAAPAASARARSPRGPAWAGGLQVSPGTAPKAVSASPLDCTQPRDEPRATGFATSGNTRFVAQGIGQCKNIRRTFVRPEAILLRALRDLCAKQKEGCSHKGHKARRTTPVSQNGDNKLGRRGNESASDNI
jgi:hypothetical protein